MPSPTPPESATGLLAYFGLETGEKAAEVASWAGPYMVVLAAGLAGMSALAHGFLRLPVWVYVAAGTLALLYFFFFVARMRKLAADAASRDDAPPR